MSPRTLVRPILAIQIGLIVLLIPLWTRTALTFDWRSLGPSLWIVLPALAAWAYFMRWPGGKNEDIYPDTFLIFALLFTLGWVIGAAQYVVVAQERPLVDETLWRLDSVMRISVPHLVAWTQQHPVVRYLAQVAYATLIPQFFFGVLVLGFLVKDRAALWEFAFHAHVCLAITILCAWVWPAIGVYAQTGTPALLSLDRFFRHFAALRSGQPMTVHFDDLEGLVSLPSFHVAGAWMVTWAFRRSAWMAGALVVLNVALTASTLLLGVHYAVDLVATALMCSISLWLYRQYVAAGSRVRKTAVTPITGLPGALPAACPAARQGTEVDAASADK